MLFFVFVLTLVLKMLRLDECVNYKFDTFETQTKLKQQLVGNFSIFQKMLLEMLYNCFVGENKFKICLNLLKLLRLLKLRFQLLCLLNDLLV